MQAIHGNPHHRPLPDQSAGSGAVETAKQGRGAPAKAAAGGHIVTDLVELSATAQELTQSGKSGQSPAHQARAAISAHPDLAGLPFGQVVKAINHGTLGSLVAPATEAAGAETDAAGIEGASATVETAEAVPESEEGAVPPAGPAVTPDAETDSALLDLIETSPDEAEEEAAA